MVEGAPGEARCPCVLMVYAGCLGWGPPPQGGLCMAVSWPQAGRGCGGLSWTPRPPVSSLGLQNHHETFGDSAFTGEQARHGVGGG